MRRGRQERPNSRALLVGKRFRKGCQRASIRGKYQPIAPSVLSAAARDRRKSVGSLTVGRRETHRRGTKISAATNQRAAFDAVLNSHKQHIRWSGSRGANASGTRKDNSSKNGNREHHAMRLGASVIGAERSGPGTDVSAAASRSACITGFGPSAGKSGASSCAYSFLGRSGKERSFSSVEELRAERRRSDVRRRRCTRTHSAMRAWISTSTNSSISSMMRWRRFERSLRRAS